MLEAAWQSSRRDDGVASLLAADFVHAHPDHSLDVVLNRLATSDCILPVVTGRPNTAAMMKGS